MRIPHGWRERLPHPTGYYIGCIENLGKSNAAGWAQGCCPFHDDASASLSVQVVKVNGGWRCFAGCGQGDLVSFHQRLTGKPFREYIPPAIWTLPPNKLDGAAK